MSRDPRRHRAVAAVEQVFASAAGMAYLGEAVTTAEHQLQAAALARAAGASEALVVAALLHDVGYLITPDPGATAGGLKVGLARSGGHTAGNAGARHEVTGANWLGRLFGPAVSEPVRLHVAAKRYLVATEPAYADRLSPASRRTLALQGGPMTAAEVADFDRREHAAAAVILRRFDDAAKDPAITAPAIDSYAVLLVRLSEGRPRSDRTNHG